MLAVQQPAPFNPPPASVAEAVGARGHRQLTPLQLKAAGLGWPDVDTDWLIAAPTSAGKTLLAEVAAAHHLHRSQKVLWLTPTRALADWTARDLKASFRPAGYDVAVSSGDHPDSDGRIDSGAWDLLVAVYEKGLQWLARTADPLAGVGLVVIDELGMLRDAERGARLDLILTLIGASPYTPRRIGLCAGGAETAPLAARLGWRLLTDDSRPRPLREGILDAASGRFHWFDRAAHAAGSEQLADSPDEWLEWLGAVNAALDRQTGSPALLGSLAAAAMLAARGEPTLLFAPSRAAARQWAAVLSRGPLPRVADETLAVALGELEDAEPCGDHALLRRAATAGVGFHHGDLAPEARAVVESGFESGALRLLVATPTLAHGLNLSALNVIQWPQACLDGAGRAHRPAPLERWRWRQQGGRAGRLGFGDAPGRSMAVAEDEPHRRRLWRAFIESDVEPLDVPNRDAAIGLGILAALGGGVSRTSANLMNLLGTPSALGDVAVADCRTANLVEGDPLLRLTPRGRVCALRGIDPAVMRRLADWIGQAADPLQTGGEAGELIAIWGLALAAPHGYWPAPRRASQTLRQARQWLEGHDIILPPPLAVAFSGAVAPVPREIAAIEAGWRLALWIGSEATSEVEARTGWSAGVLARAGEGLAWLASALADAGLADGWEPGRAAAWRILGTRLAAGAPTEGVAIARLRVPGLTRTMIQRLVADKIADIEAIAAAEPAMLAGLTKSPTIAGRLRHAASLLIEKCSGLPAKPFSLPRPAAEPQPARPLLHIDLQSPGLVRAAGSEIRLSPLAWDLLAALAGAPGRVVTRESLYSRLWPDASPEPQQLDAHRRRLLARLKPALNGKTGSLIEVIRGIGFRLNLREEEVALRRG